MSVIKTLTYCWLTGPSLLTELSASICALSYVCVRGNRTESSDDAPLYSDVLINHSVWRNTLAHRQTRVPLRQIHKLVTVVFFPFLVAHTHTHSEHMQAGGGRDRSQESCGFINYHQKRDQGHGAAQLGNFPEVMPFPSDFSKAVSCLKGEMRAPLRAGWLLHMEPPLVHRVCCNVFDFASISKMCCSLNYTWNDNTGLGK